MTISTRFASFDKITSTILSIWPKHERYLSQNVQQRDTELLQFSDRLAATILRLAEGTNGGIERLCTDYKFLCENIVMPEELHFRRHGKYRMSTFEEAFRTVYSDREFMTRYMDGLLVSDVIWLNHCQCMMNYRQTFLPSLKSGANLLEIGPGHGLLLSLADESKQLGNVTAWDISDASLALAAKNLDILGAERAVTFEKRNIYDQSIMSAENGGRFDGVVLSEVLEHLEDPLGAIRVLYHLCREDGEVWINVPANSPAPDHLYLVSDISEPAALVREAGFVIDSQFSFPTSGTTIEKAKKDKLTFNCVIIARKPQKTG